MRRFDSINDEIQVGYDARFEQRWRIVEIAGRIVMLLVVGAALFGLLGRGPYSHRSTSSAASGLTMDFEPVTRFGVQSMLTLHLHPLSCGDGATIWLSNKFIEPMGLLRTTPLASSTTPRPDGIALHFPLDPRHCQGAEVRLFAEPSGIGFLTLQARLDHRAILPATLFVVP